MELLWVYLEGPKLVSTGKNICFGLIVMKFHRNEKKTFVFKMATVPMVTMNVLKIFVIRL